MRTPADEARATATTNIQAAIQNLADIVVSQCHGHDEFTPEFKQTLTSSMNNLMVIRDKIAPPNP